MMAHVLFDSDTGKKTALLVLGLLVAAAAVRLGAFVRLQVIARDGIVYLDLARLYLAGAFSEALAHPYHPLYPLLTALSGAALDDLELAARVVSLVMGSATVVPLFFLAQTAAGTRAGVAAALFYTFQPYSVRFSVDVLSDPAFLFFFITALSLGVKGVLAEQGGVFCSALAGCFGGMAYLTRPEGILVIVFLLVWHGVRLARRGNKPRLRVLPVSGLAVFFLAVSLPYVLVIHAQCGSWQITMKPSLKKSVQNLPLLSPQEQPGAVSQPAATPAAAPPQIGPTAPAKEKKRNPDGPFWRSVLFPAHKFMETYPYLLFLFFLAGAGKSLRAGRAAPGAALTMFVLAYLAALCYLFDSVGYVSRRHFLPLITASFPLAGAGFWAAEKSLTTWAGRKQMRFYPAAGRYAAVVLMLVVMVSLAGKALKPQGADKIPLRQAGLWIRQERGAEAVTVMSNEPLVAYYARGRHVSIPPLPYPDFVRYVRSQNVDYVVFQPEDLEQGDGFFNRLRPNHLERLPFEQEGVFMYRVVRPRSVSSGDDPG